jgi:hypothetical protein
MKRLGKTIVAIVFGCLMTSGIAQCDLDGSADTGICCDPNGGDAATFAGFPTCSQYAIYADDGLNSDIDCGTITASCPAIPIDGGLSLLALAGGGLATAAMRRRREEEAAQEAV